MSKDKKLMIFYRKEVFLLLIFMGLVAMASFVVGVKVGQELNYKAEGITEEDRQLIQLQSSLEEDVHNIGEDEGKGDEELLKKINEEALKGEFDRIAKEKAQGPEDKGQMQKAFEEENTYKGKWTIQLGSYKDLADARRFADGFKVRGYNPIINEVMVEKRGIWYRVGLGVFADVAAAKKYIKSEQTLFQGQDYTIIQLR